MTEAQSNYQKLAAINVNEKIEKKNNLSYLSWAWAVDQLLRADPEAIWEYKQPAIFGNGTMMVFCTVTAFGKSMTAQLPVMDYKNRAIPDPDAFQVNTAMQRALAKAIALHGLGLYIYAGEDLPEGTDPPVSEDKEPVQKPSSKSVARDEFDKMDIDEQDYLRGVADRVKALLSADDVSMAVKELEEEKLDSDEKVALWSLFDSKQRAAIKKFNEENK